VPGVPAGPAHPETFSRPETNTGDKGLSIGPGTATEKTGYRKLFLSGTEHGKAHSGVDSGK